MAKTKTARPRASARPTKPAVDTRYDTPQKRFAVAQDNPRKKWIVIGGDTFEADIDHSRAAYAIVMTRENPRRKFRVAWDVADHILNERQPYDLTFRSEDYEPIED